MSERIVLSLEQVEQATDLVVEWVPTPEWAPEGTDREACGMYVRCASSSALDDWERTQADEDGNKALNNLVAELVVRTACNETGQRIFRDDFAPVLGAKSAAPLRRLYEVACRLSGLGEQAEQEIEGNSEASTAA